MRLAAVVCAGLALWSVTARAGTPETDGRADRLAFEQWGKALDGDKKRGADFWALERSKPTPTACPAAPGADSADFLAGCQEAQRQLALADVRRRTEPDYKRGWNAPLMTASDDDSKPYRPERVEWYIISGRTKECVRLADAFDHTITTPRTLSYNIG